MIHGFCTEVGHGDSRAVRPSEAKNSGLLPAHSNVIPVESASLPVYREIPICAMDPITANLKAIQDSTGTPLIAAVVTLFLIAGGIGAWPILRRISVLVSLVIFGIASLCAAQFLPASIWSLTTVVAATLVLLLIFLAGAAYLAANSTEATEVPDPGSSKPSADGLAVARDYRFRFVVQVFSGFLLLLLFWALPVKLADTLEARVEQGLPVSGLSKEDGSPTPKAQFLLAEHQKATSEIEKRIQQGDDWFHRKFLMIGGLVVAFLTALASDTFKRFGRAEFHAKGTAETEAPGYTASDDTDRRFSDIMRSNAACSLLALATAVAVSIDIQTGVSDTVVQQIALWLQHHVESVVPHVSTTKENTTTKKTTEGHAAAGNETAGNDTAEKAKARHPMVAQPTSSSVPEGPVHYESYLRLPGMSMHTDPVTKLLFHPHGYFLTWAIYLMYLTSFQKVCFRADLAKKPRYLSLTQARLAVAAFGLVHFCLAAFTVIRHSAPKAFYLQIGEWWVRGDVCGWLFLAPWCLLVAIHRPYWWALGRAAFRNEREDRAKPTICAADAPEVVEGVWKVHVEPDYEAKGDGTGPDAADDAAFTFLEYGWRKDSEDPAEWKFAAIIPRRKVNAIFVTIPELDTDKGKELVFRATYINTDGERGHWSASGIGFRV